MVLARDLMKAKKATLVDTIRTSRVELPTEFVAPAGREYCCTLPLLGSMRAATPHWFLTNVRKTKLLSSCRLCTFGKEPKKLPEVINFYNKTKVGVTVQTKC